MSPRRSPQAIAHSKRIKEGGDFEQHTVPADLATNGYGVIFADKSRGQFDHMAVKSGELLVVGARLTKLSAANPSFDDDEWDALWTFAQRHDHPDRRVFALVATARHAGGPPAGNGLCRCSKQPADPVRYLRITGPASLRGPGKRPPWEPWTPDWGLLAS